MARCAAALSALYERKGAPAAPDPAVEGGAFLGTGREGWQTIDISDSAEKGKTPERTVKKTAESRECAGLFVHIFIPVKMTYQYVR